MANAVETGVSPCAVIGGGPAGLIAALALAHFKVPATLVARRPAGIDNRTTALLAGSVAALEALGVWEACRAARGAAAGDADRRRHTAACGGRRRCGSRPRRSAFPPSAGTSRTPASSPRSGTASAPLLGSTTSIPPPGRSRSATCGVTVTPAEGALFRGRARDRRRRAPFALSQGGGDCGQRTRDAADCADLHYEPLPAAP